MAQLLQKGVYAFHQPVIPGHDILDAGVLGIDDNVHIGAGQVGLEGRGFDHGHVGTASFFWMVTKIFKWTLFKISEG
jgi:hypothetical protein